MAAPPVLVGAVQLTVAEALPSLAVTPVGAEGGPAGVTATEALEALPLPDAFVAVTVKVYAVPLVRPDTSQLSNVVVHVFPPGVDVTV